MFREHLKIYHRNKKRYVEGKESKVDDIFLEKKTKK